MAKWYGSLTNRVDENKLYGKVYVGQYCTEYLWSDRHAYEITKVINDKHFFIRRLTAIRTDNNGMSECQTYRYEHNYEACEQEIMLTKWGFREVYRYDLDLYNKIIERDKFCHWDRDIVEKVLAGKKVSRKKKINLSVGVADEYYDYSF